MGTRGALGFVINGVEKIAYNHFDSYPSGLGVDVLSWLRSELAKDKVDGLEGGAVAIMRAQAGVLRVVDPNSTPTVEDIDRLKEYADIGVSTQSLDDWYVLLRRTQGNPAATLKAGVIEDAHGFPLDSLFCEYAYIVDLDNHVLEAYRGFQREPHTDGRFADRPNEREYVGRAGYYPVRLVAAWKFGELPTDDEFCTAIDGESE